METMSKAEFLNKPLKERWPYLLIGFFFLNVIVKVVPLFRGIMIHPDAPVYLWSAQALETGNVTVAIAAYPMLFFPFLIMIVHKLGIDWFWAGRLISVIASCFALLPFMAIARRFSSGWPLVVVTLLFIFLPEYNARAFAVLRDPLYLSLTLFCLYYALRFIEEKSLKTFCFVIFISFFLPLLRIEGAVTAVLVNAWCVVLLFWSAREKKRLLALSLFIGGGILLGYLLFSERFLPLIRFSSFQNYFDRFSSWQLSAQSCLTALDNIRYTLPHATNGSNFWQVIDRHWPWIYFIGMLYVFVRILGWPVLVLSVIGARNVFKERDFRKIFLLVVFVGQILNIMLFYLLNGFLEVRFVLLPAILLLFFILFSLEPVVDVFYEKMAGYFPIKRKYFLIVFSCFLVLPFAYDSLFYRYRTHIPVLKEACLWVKSEILTGDGDGKWFVSGNARRIAWFLDREDMQQYEGRIGYDDIEKIVSKSSLSPSLLVLLLKKRVPEHAEIVNFLSKKYPLTSKIFVGPEKDKHIVIAVWRE